MVHPHEGKQCGLYVINIPIFGCVLLVQYAHCLIYVTGMFGHSLSYVGWPVVSVRVIMTDVVEWTLNTAGPLPPPAHWNTRTPTVLQTNNVLMRHCNILNTEVITNYRHTIMQYFRINPEICHTMQCISKLE